MTWPKLIRWTLELITGIRHGGITHEDRFCGSAASYHCRRIARTGLSNISVRRISARAWNGTVTDWLWRIARWLYGGYFIYTAVVIGRTLWIGGKGVQQPTPEAKAFYEALHATGFLYPLMGITFGVGGLALILHRTAPLGLVLLAPSVGVIFLFHLMLTGSVVWGTEWALGLVLLAWHYRSAYTALWNYTSPGVAMDANR